MADALAYPSPDDTPEVQRREDDQLIVNILDGYRAEAENARKAGPSPRDEVWRNNWDRYWGRYDHSQKAKWQSTHVMPETPQFVDRWAAAMREALTQGGRWFSAVDETGQSNELMPHIERFVEVLLSRCGRTPDGHQTDFESVFEDQMKLGALMTCSATVTWKDDWVAVESTDPREVWLDPKLRNLYRIRRYEIDKHELLSLAEETDGAGQSIYNLEVIRDLVSSVDEDARNERERSSGHGQGEGETSRAPITIHEYLCDLISPTGETIATNSLVVVANDRFVIRGPEPNPFWHGRDWHVVAPMVTVPFSAYGRTYLEDWADAADAFVELTNLILDGVFTTTVKAYAAIASLLEDPTQLEEGIAPNTVFKLDEDAGDPRQFLREIDLGALPPESVSVWTSLKQEMREGAKLSEIALGQVPPKGDITATEVSQVSQSGSAMIRSMARTVEARFLEPVLTLVFQTALQHMDFTDPRIARELGMESAMMLQARKQEFRTRQIKFRVRGISSLVDRQLKLRNLLSMLQVVSSNDLLLQMFLREVDPQRLLQELLRLFGVDTLDFRVSERERMIRQIVGQFEQAQQGGGGSPPRQSQPSPFQGVAG